jgi:hypothetical protein
MKTRTIERVDVFPTRLPVVKTFEYPDKARIEFDGALHLGSGPGIGVEPDLAALRELRAD